MADIQEQNQAAFQKQDKFSYRKVHLLGKKANQRWYADIGLGIKTPATAINGKYIDKKCPFTSDVTIRGAILKGLVISTKMERTIIVRRDYLRYVKKYRRYEKRHRNIPAHCSPCFDVKEGDIVTIGQCRPLSKTVRFNVIGHESQKSKGLSNIRKQFRML